MKATVRFLNDKRLVILAALAIGLCFPSVGGTTWTGGGGNAYLDDPQNWGGEMPKATEAATIGTAVGESLTLQGNTCSFYDLTVSANNVFDLGAGKSCLSTYRFFQNGNDTAIRILSGTVGIDPNSSSGNRVFLGNGNDTRQSLVVDGPNSVFLGAAGADNGGNQFVSIGQNRGSCSITVQNGAKLDGQVVLGQYWLSAATAGYNSFTVTGDGSRYVLSKNRPFIIGNMQPSNTVTFADSASATIAGETTIGGAAYNANNPPVFHSSEGNSLLVRSAAAVTAGTVYVGRCSSGNRLEVLSGGSMTLTDLYVGNERQSADAITDPICDNLVAVSGQDSRLTVKNLRIGVKNARENRVEIGSGAVLDLNDAGILEVGYGADYLSETNELAVLSGGVIQGNGPNGFRVIIGRTKSGRDNTLRVEGSLLMPNNTVSRDFWIGYCGPESKVVVANGGLLSMTNAAVSVGCESTAANCQLLVTNKAAVVLRADKAKFGGNDPRFKIGAQASGARFLVDDSTFDAPQYYLQIGDTSTATGSDTVFSGGANVNFLRAIVGSNSSGNRLTISNAALKVTQQFDISYGIASGTNTVVFAGTNSTVTADITFRPRNDTVIEVRAEAGKRFVAPLIRFKDLENAANVRPTIRLVGKLEEPVTVFEAREADISDVQFNRMTFELPSDVKVVRTARTIGFKPKKGLVLVFQ